MEKTIFEGQVNDKTFTDRDEMSKYIQYCITNNIDIRNVATHTETRNVSNENNNSSCASYRKLTERRTTPPVTIAKWPEIYKDLPSYLAPYVDESAFNGNAKHNKAVIDDAIAKLDNRMQYYIHNFEDNPTMNNDYFTSHMIPVLSRLDSKSDWCSHRINELTPNMANADERIKRLQAEIDTIKAQKEKCAAIREMYDQVGGFCEALKDQILESGHMND